MLNDDQDREMQRNQLYALVLMISLFLVWSYFFMPAYVPPPQQTQEETNTLPQDITPEPIETPAEPQDSPFGLPPVATTDDPQADEITIADEYLELTFTAVGGRLKRGLVILGEEGVDSVQLVPEVEAETADVDAVYPLGLRFAGNYLRDDLDQRRWEHTLDSRGKTVTFTLAVPDQATLTKSFRLTASPRVLEADVQYQNNSDVPQTLGLDTVEPAFSLNWGPNVSSGDIDQMVKQTLVSSVEPENELFQTEDLEPPLQGTINSKIFLEPAWLAVKSKYFLVAIKPEFDAEQGWATGDPDNFRFGIGVPRTVVASGQTIENRFKLYLGPMEMSSLKVAWPGLDTSMKFFTMNGFGFMDTFAKLLLSLMQWSYNHLTPNYGVAIILVTFLVRSAMYPLTLKSTRSMKKMQMLAPEIEKLKKEHEGDQQEVQKKMMELYRERGVNPLGGCFPMLLQMPVFIAFYRILWSAFELRGESFLWMSDLTKPDELFPFPGGFEIPLIFTSLTALNILPILCAIAMVLSQKLTPASGPAQNPQQKMIMTVMPIMMGVIFYNMSAGINLYILTSTIVGIIQNYFVHVKDPGKAPDKDVPPNALKTPGTPTSPKPPKKTKRKTANKPKHFYAAAQKKKREMAKEAQREKKKKHQRRSSGGAEKETKRS